MFKRECKGCGDQPFSKEINVGVNHRPIQQSQQKPEIEMGLHQQKYCHLGLKEAKKMRQNEGRYKHELPFKKREKGTPKRFRDHRSCYSHHA